MKNKRDAETRKSPILPPHGGCGLINRNLPSVERQHFKEQASKSKVFTIGEEDLSTFYRIADGTLSPLEGPMDKDEMEYMQRIGDHVYTRA